METTVEAVNPKDIFGFWIYILTDCILFATLFATYIVLTVPFNAHAVGPALAQHIDLDYVLVETFALLTSNFTFGLAVLAFNKGDVPQSINRLIMTFILGCTFVGMELYEFRELSLHGFNWATAAPSSAFFALVGTHGLHVSFGLLWIAVMIVQLNKFQTHIVMHKRMLYLGLFWNFLDVIWIFVFSIVYLIGAM